MVLVYQSGEENKQKEEDSDIQYLNKINNNEDLMPNILDNTVNSNINYYSPTTSLSIEKPIIPVIEQDETDDNIEVPENINDFYISFIKKYRFLKKSQSVSTEGTIQVSDVLSGLARLYEKIRSTVEYKSDNLLRKNAIERILKRLFWERKNFRLVVDKEKLAEHLLKELIWAKYLPNNEIPKSKIRETIAIIDKYQYILENLDDLPPKTSLSKAKNWIFGLASSEIEDNLDPSYRDLFNELMFSWFNKNYEWKSENLSENQKEVQLYLAIHRAFSKSDNAIMRYFLLKKEITDWDNTNIETLKYFILNFPQIYQKIEEHLNYPNRQELYRYISRHSAVFDILKQMVVEQNEDPLELAGDESLLEENTKNVCEKNYKDQNMKVSRGIMRSILYIFITKVVFALILEVPYEVYAFGDVRYIPITANIILPPILMFIVGLSIKTPGKKNTDLIIKRMKPIIYKTDKKEKITLTVEKKRNLSPMVKIFSLFYFVLLFVVFGGISFILNVLNFSIFGMIVFFFFLSLVLLFAFRIRYQANQLKVEQEKEGFLGHLTGYFTLPFLNLGFYLSRGLAQINIFTVFLDLIIEAPLKNIIEIFEEWIGFMREKRQNVVEISD